MAIRDYRIGFFNRLGGGLDLTDDEKDRSVRQGLLGLAAGLAGTGGGFGNALAQGLQTGLLAMNDSADSQSNRKYQQSIMARTKQGMERNAQVEQLRSQVIGPDGQINQQVWPQYVAADPEGAKQIKDALGQQPRKNPGQPVYLRDATGQFEDPYIWDDQAGGFVPAGNFLAQGPLANAVAAQPQIGITSGSPVPAAAGPMMGQAFYDEIGKLISPYGAMVGSTNGGKHNPGSLHYDGRALDIPLGASATDAVRANADRIVADLTNKGYKVRDERTRPEGQAVWGGPHLHVEASGGASPSAAPLGRRPIKADEAKERYRTMTPEEIAQAGLPAGTVAQISPNGQFQIVNKPRDLPGAQTQVIDNGDGTQTIIPAGKTTEDQNKSAGYALRMERALGDIAASAKSNPSANRPGIGTAVLDMFPDSIANYGRSQERQNVEAAQLDALDAALTLNTGAAYTKEQLQGLRKSYFPQPGDEAKTIEQKRARLESLIQTARLRARGAYPTTTPQQTPAGAGQKPKRLKFNPQTGKIE